MQKTSGITSCCTCKVCVTKTQRRLQRWLHEHQYRLQPSLQDPRRQKSPPSFSMTASVMLWTSTTVYNEGYQSISVDYNTTAAAISATSPTPPMTTTKTSRASSPTTQTPYSIQTKKKTHTHNCHYLSISDKSKYKTILIGWGDNFIFAKTG
ncbi:hypothetical protein DPMN_164784 [Dreissena polymorpha]|uniref:Uncharacterized protein n=1 Tax=Dreissena polymorpha TaxID=45954 RepID=A0A9D4EVM9_DREPO|nr:hypothetical protein DPMN_164784 [Dreissena polymorpha]